MGGIVGGPEVARWCRLPCLWRLFATLPFGTFRMSERTNERGTEQDDELAERGGKAWRKWGKTQGEMALGNRKGALQFLFGLCRCCAIANI